MDDDDDGDDDKSAMFINLCSKKDGFMDFLRNFF
jgi:hypothetical protein